VPNLDEPLRNGRAHFAQSGNSDLHGSSLRLSMRDDRRLHRGKEAVALC
jgi:hypothetical protein